LIAERSGGLALLELRYNGKTITTAKGEMGAIVECFEFYAGAVTKNYGETLPPPITTYLANTVREPVGVVGAIARFLPEHPHLLAVEPDGAFALLPGMFVQVAVGLGASREVIPLPASAISYAPYGDSVFVITDLKNPKGETYRGVRQQFVKVEGSRGDQVGVVSGLKPGDEVVSSGVFKLRNGAAVQVNNKVQPGNNPAPKPEDS